MLLLLLLFFKYLKTDKHLASIKIKAFSKIKQLYEYVCLLGYLNLLHIPERQDRLENFLFQSQLCVLTYSVTVPHTCYRSGT